MNKKQIYTTLIVVFIVIILIVCSIFFYIKKDLIDKKDNKLEYSEETANSSKMGTTIYTQNLSYDGYTIIDNLLIDMNGTILKNFDGVLVSFFKNKNYVLYTNVGKNNNKELVGIKKFNSKDELLFDYKKNTHHEIFINDDESIIFASGEVKKYPINNTINDVKFDLIYHFSTNGTLIEKYSFFEHIEEFHETFPEIFKTVEENLNRERKKTTDAKNRLDYFHLNSIQILPKNDLEKSDKRFQKGNWLISVNFPKLMVILDKDSKSIVWFYNPKTYLHGPRMQKNGNILYFHNGEENCSKILEINPLNNSIVWEYNNDCSANFYSFNRGFAQRLPNNNTLITESTRGRAFEITMDKKIVWEWYHPNINEENKRLTFYRAIRIDKNLIE